MAKGSSVIRHPHIVGGIWLALGSFLFVVAAAGAIQSVAHVGNWSLRNDGPLLLLLVSWALISLLGGVLLTQRRSSGQMWIALASATGVVLIVRRLLREPIALYYRPVLTTVLIIVLAFFVYCLVAVTVAGLEIRTGRSTARRSRLEWGATFLALMALLGAVFAPVVSAFARQSSAARWWRCRETPSPVLSKLNDPWSMTYSWTAGNGPGSVRATVRSDGRTQIESQRIDEGAPHIRTAQLPSDIILKLARAIDDTGILCERPEPRLHRIWDLGRFAIQVRHGLYNREVYMDECHRLPDGSGIAAVAKVLQAQVQLLGGEILWAPYGAEGSGPSCTEGPQAKGQRNR